MADENPTATGGASISDRIEALLDGQSGAAPIEAKQDQEAQQQQAEPDESEVPASDETEQDEGPQISLADVARFLKVDESTLDIDEEGSVIFKTKVDGKEGAAKPTDLLKSYQLQGHVDAKTREVAEAQKQYAERVKQFEERAKAETERFNTLANIAHQELMRDAAQIDWNALAQSDPAQYVQRQHEFSQRQGRVNQLLSEAQSQQQKLQQSQQQRESQTLQQEALRLPTLIPEWADQKVREQETADLTKWLSGKGASVESINGLKDAALVAALRAGMLAERTNVKAAEVEKKVRLAPKLVKPGQSVDAKDRANESVRSLKENIRKSGGKRGIAEYLLATGKV